MATTFSSPNFELRQRHTEHDMTLVWQSKTQIPCEQYGSGFFESDVLAKTGNTSQLLYAVKKQSELDTIEKSATDRSYQSKG